MSTLQDRRAALTAEITTLEREQGAAVLDGKPFDAKPLIAAREALEALDTAEAEQSRREREAEALVHAEDSAKARQEAREALSSYLGSLDRVKALSESLSQELKALRTEGDRLPVLARRLGGQTSAWQLDGRAAEKTVSGLMASILAPLGRDFGQITWPAPPLKPDWSAHAAHIRSIIDPLIGETK